MNTVIRVVITDENNVIQDIKEVSVPSVHTKSGHYVADLQTILDVGLKASQEGLNVSIYTLWEGHV